ncbi:MAG: hypothetical protein JEZ10_00720 [Verrucomicrobia bacterium]|nr:hypothetical protein [Verrucomicrobiota bacterium]
MKKDVGIQNKIFHERSVAATRRTQKPILPLACSLFLFEVPKELASRRASFFLTESLLAHTPACNGSDPTPGIFLPGFTLNAQRQIILPKI